MVWFSASAIKHVFPEVSGIESSITEKADENLLLNLTTVRVFLTLSY